MKVDNSLVESLVLEKPLNMKEKRMKTKDAKLTDNEKVELEYLAQLDDDKINVKDIPEMLDWSGAKRGVFYKPVKQQITLRLDADIVHWFRARMQGRRGYQTEINRALRDYIKGEEKESN